MLAEITSRDVWVMLGAVGGLLTVLSAFVAAMFKIVRSALTPGRSESLHAKLDDLAATFDDRVGNAETRLTVVETKVDDHGHRIHALETGRHA